MKNKHKMMCLLMAAMISVNGVGTLGSQVVYATNSLKLTPNEISVQSENKQLKKGDVFGITIKAYDSLQQDIGTLLGGITEISITGDVNTDYKLIRSVSEIANNGVEIVVEGLIYEGPGDKLNIKIDNGETRSFSINVESVTAGGAVEFINPGTINVVAGESQQITLRIKNTQKLISQPGELKVDVKDSKVKKEIKIKEGQFKIPKLAPSEVKEYRVILEINKDLPRGIYELAINVDGVAHTLKLKVDSNFMPPSLQVNMNYNGAFQQNTPQQVNLELTNVGHVAAKNITAKITGESVVVTNGSNIKYVENIESGKTVNVPVTLMVSDTSKYTVPLNLELKYIDDEGKEQTSTQTINLSTKGSIAQKEITLTTTKEPIGAVAVGDTFDIAFDLHAPDEAENVTIKVEPTGGVVPKTKNLFIEPKLAKGQKKSYAVSFVAPQEVKTGTYSISMTAGYTLNGKEVEIKTYATVFIDNAEQEAEEGKGKPKVIVGTYATNPVVVKAGEEFNLDIGFLNTHKNQKITNFKANLTVHEEGENNTGSVFTPVGASNTFFIPTLEPGQLVDKKITMYTLPNAKSKTYEVTLEMSYDDASGNEVTASEFIGIPVEQVTKLEVAEVQTEMVEVGMSSDMTATIYNTGKTDISNVMISIEGEGFDVQDGKMFEGLFEKGSDLMYMPTIIPSMPGIVKGEIVISYEDVTGQEQSLRHPFEMEVMEPQMPPDLGGEGFEPEITEPVDTKKPINWSILFGGTIGVGVAAGITAIVLKKRRKKLEELELDED